MLLEEQVEASEPLPDEPTGPLFIMLKDSINRFKNVIRDLTDIAKAQRDVDGKAEKVIFKDVFSNVESNFKDLLQKENVKFHADFENADYIHFSKKICTVLCTTCLAIL